MERKVPFIENETYHIYSRGVEKRRIFMSDSDRDRFMLLLLACNREEPVRIDNLLRREQGEPLLRVKDGPSLVQISSYALMPTHVHLLVRERRPGNISKFMLKLMTAYSMYFNTRYERSGPLFTRPFRASHIDSDAYLRWAFSYVNLNPLELFQPDWKSSGISDISAARNFLNAYEYSSYTDYFGPERIESKIIDRSQAPQAADFDSLIETLSSDMPEIDTRNIREVTALV